MRAPRLVLAIAAVLLLALAAHADAHGPCPSCLSPHRVAPGDRLRIDYPTFKAVLNPTRHQLSLGPKPYCYGCQLKLWRDRAPGQPAVTLGTWRPRRDHATVRVPDVKPGRYLVALFDGSEGGTHYTWAYIEVSADLSGDDQSSSTILIATLVAGAALVSLLVAALTARRRSRRR